MRFEVKGTPLSAGYCHCTHCQKRTGTGSSVNCRVAQQDFQLLRGEEQLNAYQPPTGVPKIFCGNCGSALFSGDPFNDDEVAIRLGTFDGDPGIRPQFRQYVDSAAVWEPVEEDGLTRHPRSRNAAQDADADSAAAPPQ